MSQVEWPEVIDAQSDLKVLFCSVVFGDEDSGAVDQAVQWQVAFLESISKVADGAASKQKRWAGPQRGMLQKARNGACDIVGSGQTRRALT